MASARQLLTRFQRQLGQFQQKEEMYRYKLQQLNQGRTHLANQIDMLHLDYNKKIKQMEGKIKSLTAENQSLLRQNQIFKGQIETFNSRLLEKQKLISSLVSQQRERSQKPYLQNSRSSKNQEQRSEAASQGNQSRQVRQRLFKKNATSKVKTHRQEQCSSVDTYNLNLNSPNHNLATDYAPQNLMSTDMPVDIGIQKPQSVPVFNSVPNEIKKRVPPPAQKRIIGKIENPKNVQDIQHQSINHSNNIPKPTISQKKVAQKAIRPPIIDQKRQQVLITNNFLSHFKQEQQNNNQKIAQNEFQDESNLMSYFNQPYEKSGNRVEQSHQLFKLSQERPNKAAMQNVVKRKKNEKAQFNQNSFQQYQTPSGLDFFNKLGQGQAIQIKQEPTDFFNKISEHNVQESSQAFMNSDIQQSSIDYQQNSLMSSTANMFTDISDLTAPSKEAGRAKKKARRDKIKMVDPKSFE